MHIIITFKIRLFLNLTMTNVGIFDSVTIYGCAWLNDWFWIRSLDLLMPYTLNSKLHVILRYRKSTHFIIHRYTHSCPQSSLLLSWQRIYNSITATAAYMKSSLHSLIPFLQSHHSTAISRDILNSISAGLGSSLYSLGSDPTKNAVPVVTAQ
jgi:hypothetical protein